MGISVGVSILLVCAVLASLTAGVLAAYGLCVAMFGVLRMRAERASERRVAVAAGAQAEA